MAKSHLIINPFPEHIDRRDFANYLCGLIDGEGYFGLKTGNRKSGPQIRTAHFLIRLRADDIEVLKLVQSFLGCGSIYERPAQTPTSNPTMSFLVGRISDLMFIVVPHFDTFHQWAKKRRDFSVWKEGVALLYKASQKKQDKIRNGRGGSMPKWTKDECRRFDEYVQALKNVRMYEPNMNAPVIVNVPSIDEKQGTFWE